MKHACMGYVSPAPTQKIINDPHPVGIKFKVVKKSTGEFVGEFETLEEANEVIEKAKKQKKAALILG
jgi:hypothetical protein